MSAPDRDDRAAMFALADTMFGAIEDGDIDALRAVFADDIVVWANFDGVDRPLEEALRIVGWLMAKLSDRKYEIIRREMIPGGFVQQHILRGTAPDGTAVAMPACIIATIADAEFTRVEEYLDPAGVAALAR